MCPFYVAEKERFALRALLQHQFNFAALYRLISLCCCHSKLLPASSAGRGRNFSLSCRNRRSSSTLLLLNHEKGHIFRCVLFTWRRKRDSNSRAGYPTYALSRGASSAYLSISPCKQSCLREIRLTLLFN